MPIEQAIVQGIRPHMMAAQADRILERERVKGCRPDISLDPVRLEPRYRPLTNPRTLLEASQEPDCVPGLGLDPRKAVRLRLWVGHGQECDWTRSERVLKQLQALAHRVAFEITGNQRGLRLGFLCHQADELVLKAALLGEFMGCDLSLAADHPFNVLPSYMWSRVVFRDFFPQPPYSGLFTRPNELHFSPFEPFLNVLAQLPADTLGFYQALIEPVSSEHDWHRNVEMLTDLDYMRKLLWGAQLPQKYAQQAPSGDLRSKALEVDTKSHNDKPFFAAAVRVGLLGGPSTLGPDRLRALCVFMGLLLHDGQPLASISEQEYGRLLASEQVEAMFRLGAAHRPGFLLNSCELAGFLHVPPLCSLEDRNIIVDILDVFDKGHELTSDGTCAGTTTHAGVQRPVHLPALLRLRGMHIIGNPGTGKSTFVRHMATEDARRGDGIAVLDPHGDLAEGILNSLPKDCIDRTVYFAPGDEEWVPLWNPLKLRPGQDASRTADEIVAGLRSISEGWGDRLGTLLHQGIRGLLCVSDATLFDVAMVLKDNSRDWEARRKRILAAVNSPLALEFWGYDIKRYGKVDFGPVQHKLNKLMSSEYVELMFSQPENRIDFREIMDKGMIFIADLSRIGPESRDVLGKFILSFIHLAALSRSNLLPGARRPFHVFVDEAHRFVGDTVEDLIAESRKYRVSLTFAHQYLRQFPRETLDALEVVGTTAVFGVHQGDAERLAKSLGSHVEAEDLTALKVGEAIARIDKDVLRVLTPDAGGESDPAVRQAILQRSHERYCTATEELRRTILRRRGSWAPRPERAPGRNAADTPESFVYAEL